MRKEKKETSVISLILPVQKEEMALDLTIETGGRHIYSSQFKALTSEFYLD
jgi:hypothetical protein